MISAESGVGVPDGRLQAVRMSTTMLTTDRKRNLLNITFS